MSPEMVTALGGIVLGLAPIAAGLIGKRGADAAERDAAPPADPAATGLAALVENLQEERDRAQRLLTETERELRETHQLLAEARSEVGEQRSLVARLTAERTELRQTITDLGGFLP